jgi:hypothetical protein
METTPPTDYDSPWKEALAHYLPDALALFFPEVAAQIDWTRGYTLLDKELQQVTRDADLGRRLADTLVQVWRRDGTDAWVLIHIEVQGQPEHDFARRMFVYYYRIFDRYERPIMSVAVLGDEQADWRPSRFTHELWGCTLELRYPVVKLLDWRAREDELAASANPFAVVVRAHLAAQETRGEASDIRSCHREPGAACSGADRRESTGCGTVHRLSSGVIQQTLTFLLFVEPRASHFPRHP